MAKGGTIRSMVVVAAAVIVLMLMKGTAAETLTVRDDSGWRLLSSPNSWAAKHTFAVGDTLEFKFVSGFHTVAMVTSKGAHDNCDSMNAKLFETGPTEIPLTTEGEVYVCTISTHCAHGQKLAIAIGAAGSKPIAPTTSQEQSPSAAYLGINLISLAFLALVMGFWY